jgi:hypothetical protein
MATQENITRQEPAKQPEPDGPAARLGRTLAGVGSVLTVVGVILWGTGTLDTWVILGLLAGVILLAVGSALRMDSPLTVGALVAGAGMVISLIGVVLQDNATTEAALRFWGLVAGFGGWVVIVGIATFAVGVALSGIDEGQDRRGATGATRSGGGDRRTQERSNRSSTTAGRLSATSRGR